jgi:hypothetical protein
MIQALDVLATNPGFCRARKKSIWPNFYFYILIKSHSIDASPAVIDSPRASFWVSFICTRLIDSLFWKGQIAAGNLCRKYADLEGLGVVIAVKEVLF